MGIGDGSGRSGDGIGSGRLVTDGIGMVGSVGDVTSGGDTMGTVRVAWDAGGALPVRSAIGAWDAIAGPISAPIRSCREPLDGLDVGAPSDPLAGDGVGIGIGPTRKVATVTPPRSAAAIAIAIAMAMNRGHACGVGTGLSTLGA